MDKSEHPGHKYWPGQYSSPLQILAKRHKVRMTMAWFKESVSHKKKFLASLLKAPLEQLGGQCSTLWGDAEKMANTLQSNLCRLPHCQLLYAVDTQGKQISANISRTGNDNTWLGQDLSLRPYLKGNLPFKGMILSAVYMSQRSMEPCITAMQAVHNEKGLCGFIAADFHMKDLPDISNNPLQSIQWQQHLSRATATDKPRVIRRRKSTLDDNIDYLIYVITTLFQEHGIFHCELHFTDSRCTLWSVEDPFRYHVHSIDELMNPELFLRYSKQEYDKPAAIEAEKIPPILAQLKALRIADDTIYLYSASLNIMNGLVGLSFSSGNSQYMDSDDFLNHDLAFWVGQPDGKTDALEITTPN